MRDCADCATGTPCVDHCSICTKPVNRPCPHHPDPDPSLDALLDEAFGPLDVTR